MAQQSFNLEFGVSEIAADNFMSCFMLHKCIFKKKQNKTKHHPTKQFERNANANIELARDTQYDRTNQREFYKD